jgi:hypothetical protein
MNVNPDPFPHIILDDYWPDEFLEKVLDEVPDNGGGLWRRFTARTEAGKGEMSDPSLWGPTTKTLYERLNELGPKFAEAFGMPRLYIKPVGGGYHSTGPGGRLAVHTDFNQIDDMYRRLNVLVFLNHGWRREYGGVLELHGDDGITEVLPIFNRTIVFATSDSSWHGHPTPVADGHVRRSFAAYYFSKEAPADFSTPHSTVWHPTEMADA